MALGVSWMVLSEWCIRACKGGCGGAFGVQPVCATATKQGCRGDKTAERGVWHKAGELVEPRPGLSLTISFWCLRGELVGRACFRRNWPLAAW